MGFSEVLHIKAENILSICQGASMNEIATVLEPVVPPRAAKSRQPGHELRREVHNMLRDVAFVLAQTHRVREEILHEQPTQSSPRQ
jgi:hypothetical protein